MQKGEVFTRALPFDDESHRGIKSRTNKILKKGGANPYALALPSSTITFRLVFHLLLPTASYLMTIPAIFALRLEICRTP